MSEDTKEISLRIALIPIYGYYRILRANRFDLIKKSTIALENIGLYGMLGFIFGAARLDTLYFLMAVVGVLVVMYFLELELIFTVGDRIKILGWPEMKRLAQTKGRASAALEITASSIYHAVFTFFFCMAMGAFVVNGFTTLPLR